MTELILGLLTVGGIGYTLWREYLINREREAWRKEREYFTTLLLEKRTPEEKNREEKAIEEERKTEEETAAKETSNIPLEQVDPGTLLELLNKE